MERGDEEGELFNFNGSCSTKINDWERIKQFRMAFLQAPTNKIRNSPAAVTVVQILQMW